MPPRSGRASARGRACLNAARPARAPPRGRPGTAAPGGSTAWSPSERAGWRLCRVLEEVAPARLAAVDDVEEDLLEMRRHRPAATALLVVHRANRRHLRSGAAQEPLGGAAPVGAH